MSLARLVLVPLMLTTVIATWASPGAAADSAAVKKLLADPPREYASAPLWVWNDMLTEDQITDTLRDLAGQKIKQVFVHPRPGLMTPYLSADWFRLWKVALAEAEKLDMNVWIYDENSYPSGFAGGWVPELMPESRGRGLAFKETDRPGKPDENVVGVYLLRGDAFEDITRKARAGESLPKGKYLVASVQRASNSPWHGGRSYVDLMYPGVTEKFLEVTLEAYRREIGGQFGKRVPGSFTDEPELRPAGGLPWTDHLPAEFQKRWGYNLVENLPSLHRPVGDWRRVRHDYYQVLLDQFIEHWAKPYYDYCAKHDLEFTGHYWDHEWPNCVGVPDSMAMSAWQQRPGIDCLMNQYREDTHAQFGNVRMVKELSSVANQLGRKRTLCEIYGAGGWDLRFEDMKRIGDWLQVLGVNMFDEHLSYVTLRGARKADHPQSFSYHEPWWDCYHIMAEYFTRMSAAMSQGEQVNSVLVIEPTSTAWMYQGDAARLKPVGDQFFQLLMALEKAQAEYDIGCEDILARHGSVEQWTALNQKGEHIGKTGGSLKVGRRHYSLVVLPPLTENLNAKTMELLEDYLKAGGRVLACGPAPTMVDGRPSDRGPAAAKLAGWKQVGAEAAPAEALGAVTDGFAIVRAAGDQGNLFHHRRKIDDGEILLVVNTSLESPTAGTIRSAARGAEQWDLHTGKAAPYPLAAGGEGIKVAYQLPPCGSLLLFLSKEKTAGVAATGKKREVKETIQPTGSVDIRRIEPNVLTLDYLDVTAGGQSLKAVYQYHASQFAFQRNGMDRNPWNSAVQFRDELISKKFPPTSGVEATYRFTIDGPVPKPLAIVIERPDLYTITCNGTPVTAAKDSWWLDKVFGKIDITAAAKTGENAVTIEAAPFTIYHELESAYLLGDFTLRPAKSGFTVAAAQPVKLGLWNEQGMPFYARGVSYTERFDVPKPAGRYVLRANFYGSVAKIIVNGKPAGYLPGDGDVTDALRQGDNKVELVVIGTLKNTLGPHHMGSPRGTAWPSMFQKGPEPGPPPGEKYDTIGYGLREPLVLDRVE